MKKSSWGAVGVVLTLFVSTACAGSLATADVNKSLTRFINEYVYVKRNTENTGTLGSVGPIVIQNNESKVEFTIKYTRAGKPLEEKAVATFNRMLDGKWILTKVEGTTWGLGWSSDPGELNWEVK